MTWCESLLARATLSDFGEKLAMALEVSSARPVTRLIQHLSSSGSRVYQGWRSESISSCIDECVRTDSALWFSRVERPDSTGRRLILAYANKGDGARAYRRRHRQKLNADSNERMKQWRESLKPEWHAYCVAYTARFVGSSPMAFGRWIRFERVNWLKNGSAGLVFCEPSGMRRLIERDHVNRQRGGGVA